MCGVVGWLHLDDRPADVGELVRARETLAHRGPDDAGLYVDGPLALGFRRLSILDLTASGHQPMANEDGSLWIVFNGEIYNYVELRRTLANRHSFSSTSDTEVLLHLYEEQGPAMLQHLNGMFAMAIWDARRGELFLARDRLGVKPLFVFETPRRFAFASELKALETLPDCDREIDATAPQTYLRCGFIPSPQSIYRRVRKLEPASWVRVRRDGKVEGPLRYWRLPLPTKPRLQDVSVWTERVGALLQDAVKLRLRSDVPVGIFLSGGIDSGLVTALAATAASGIRTYTVSLKGRTDDEAPFARQIAERYATTAHFEEVESDILASLPEVAAHLDEPFADPSAIPTDAISLAAHKHVKVLLSGDGGDEMFAGYREYLNGWRARLVDVIPYPLRHAVFAGAAKLIPDGSRRRSHCTRLSLPSFERNMWIHHYPYDVWQSTLLHPEWRKPLATLQHPIFAAGDGVRSLGPLDQMQYADINFYLPEDILVKVDRMSMRHSLEVRSPFLDYRVAELALQIPERIRLHGGQLKYVLKRIGKSLLPADVLAHPKQGFSIPLAEWFRGPASTWVKDLLLDTTTRQRGFFEPTAVRRIVAEHQAGRRDASNLIWAMLVFETWFRARTR